MYVLSNNGASLCWKDEDYVTGVGEIAMGDDIPSTAAIQAAFPNYVAPNPDWIAQQQAAAVALDSNDGVAIRCAKAGVSYPAAWLAYDTALRAIVKAASGDPVAAAVTIAARPSYPAGT